MVCLFTFWKYLNKMICITVVVKNGNWITNTIIRLLSKFLLFMQLFFANVKSKCVANLYGTYPFASLAT